jgi:hypothetical protein
MLGEQLSLVLFYPNLAVDAHGVVLALNQRDWNALIGLAQRAGCLSAELEATGWLTRDEEDEESSPSYRSWAMDMGGASCPIFEAILAPYAMSPTTVNSGNFGALLGDLHSHGHTSFSISGFYPNQRNLEGGGQLPVFLHDLFVVLWETYNKRLDAPPPAADPWLHICRALVPVHDTNGAMQAWCSSYYPKGWAPW